MTNKVCDAENALIDGMLYSQMVDKLQSGELDCESGAWRKFVHLMSKATIADFLRSFPETPVDSIVLVESSQRAMEMANRVDEAFTDFRDAFVLNLLVKLAESRGHIGGRSTDAGVLETEYQSAFCDVLAHVKDVLDK